MSYVLAAAMLWAAFFWAVGPREWRRYYPQVLFGALLGTICDLVGVTTYQWHYFGPTTGGLSLWSDLGIAPPQAGLFAWFRRRFPLWHWAAWLSFSLANTLGEWLLVRRDWIVYGAWRPLKAFLFYLGFFGVLRLHQIFLDWLEAGT